MIKIVLFLIFIFFIIKFLYKFILNILNIKFKPYSNNDENIVDLKQDKDGKYKPKDNKK